MFNKLVIIEKINMLDEDVIKLSTLAKKVVYYKDLPQNDDEIIKRINDADAALLSYTSKIDSYVIDNCKNLKYIGMCCSLYSKESANVDIEYAEKNNIVVKGIRDYGDNGVAEYVIHELTGFLENYDGSFKWSEYPQEISSLKCAVIGLGTSGTLIARTLKFFGAEVSYYSRTRKEKLEKEYGFIYRPLDECLKDSDAIFLALNKNVLLLGEHEFKLMKGKKILFNTSIGPGFEVEHLRNWLNDKNHYFFGDTLETIGDIKLWDLDNTFTIGRSSGGSTFEAYQRLGEKVIDNITAYFKENLIK